MSNRLADRGTDFSSFVDLLSWRADRQPDQQGYTFLLDGETDQAGLTYAELDRQARAIGALLQSAGATGARALLLYPPGLDYVAAFFGCLYAGFVAVPAYPPDPARLDRTLPRLQAIVADAQPAVVLTTAPILSMATALPALDAAFQSMRWLATDALAGGLAEEWRSPAINSATLAFLQYTSGSTAAPKGVMLTHGNLLYNSTLIQRCFEHTPASRGVIWLPPYHDMGLIGGVLQPLYAGFPVVLMSPVSFLQRPFRWLQAVSHYRATTSGGPNFAYDLCVRKITPEQRATLDLSAWRVAFNGAEPIRPDTLDRFATTFAPCGFRREAFYPCYGLAEATLIVSGGHAADPPVVRLFQGAAPGQNPVVAEAAHREDDRLLAGSGRTLIGQQIAVVDPQSLTGCLPGQVGEIWVSGPSVAQGYWGQPGETERSFHAFRSDSREGPFLRTGDLGFMQDGELFVTGRLKDLIIIRGRNHYPQDIELTVEQSHRVLRPGCGAAFSIDIDGDERLVVVQEVERQSRGVNVDEVAAAVRREVAERHELQAYAVVLIKPGSIPKTSSGKIQRHACRAAFLTESLEVLGQSILEEHEPAPSARELTREALMAQPPEAHQQLLEAYLQEQAARLLRAEPSLVDPRQPVSAMGLDSLMAVELQHTIETDLDVVMPMVNFLQAQSIAQLAAEILSRLSAMPGAPAPALAPAKDGLVEHPLSLGQRALWFLYQLAPESAAYNIATAVRVLGELDISALRYAFQALSDRHPSLRTTFTAPAGEPVQRIHAHVPICMIEEDATGWSAASLNDRLVAEAHRPFNLEHSPLLRVHLFRQAAHTHVLLLVMHHSISDLWSLVVLTHELGLLYTSQRTGSSAPLAPLALHYTDYARWQAELLAGTAGERLWAYWQQQLAGALPVLDLPTDRPRPSVQTYRGAAHAFTLNEEQTQQLRALAQATGTTVYTVLLAAFQVLLHGYTNQDDMLIGSPTTGRNRAELANVVGYFVNPVVLRADLSANPPFLTLLAQVRSIVLAAFAHQEYPFALLVERLQPERDPSRSPLFQVMFVLQKAHLYGDEGLTAFALGASGAQMQMGELALEALVLDQQVAQFDLTLVMAEVAEGLAGALQYNVDLFDAATVARMAGHLQVLLAGIVADPRRRLADLPLLTAFERQQVLATWNDTQAAYPQDALHRLFEAQVEQVPDAIAVVFDRRTTNDQRPTTTDQRPTTTDQRPPVHPFTPSPLHPFTDQHLTYRELNQRANQLAQHLRSLDVGPGKLVGIGLERSLDLIVAILGVLKAGGAYVPLDPTYPEERLAFMLEDSQAAVLITSNHTETRRHGDTETVSSQNDSLSPHHPITLSPCHLVTLSGPWPASAPCAVQDSDVTLDPDNLAYVIYTSGSTGRPKGVVCRHSSVVNLLADFMRRAPLEAGVSGSLWTSLSFDVSVYEIFSALLAGGALHIVPEPVRTNGPTYIRWLALRAIQSAYLPPFMVEDLAAWLRSEASAPPLRRLLVGVEPIRERSLADIRARLPGLRIINGYGPTEATICATLYDVQPNHAGEGNTPIGRPVQNTLVYVLGRQLQPVPVGVVGELYIAGAGLAYGYLNRPDLTAERFIPNPFAQGMGDGGWGMGNESSIPYPPSPIPRLYKTGDLVRYRPDGNIEFLGRTDQQVKVRGFRVELGEIEAALREHPAVQTCAVVAHEDAPGEKRLVAYVVPKIEDRGLKIEDSGSDAPDPLSSILYPLSSELRGFLQARLPGYMVPAAFVLLSALPLTPSGKLDRRALPAPDTSRPDQDKGFVAPRTPTEEQLAGIMAEILLLERVGIYDSFFELGGHSLLATQVIARLRAVFGVELPLRSLFETPTVAGLAEQVETVRHDAQGLPPLRRRSTSSTALPLSFAQQRMWLLDQFEPDNPAYTIPAAARLKGQLDLDAWTRSLNEIVRRHATLRTTFGVRDGRPVQVIAPALTLRVPLLDLHRLPALEQEAAVQRLMTAEVRRPFDLARGPLLRTSLLRLDAEEHLLLLTMHHIISDGWSLNVFVEELAALYAAYLAGASSPLPELPIQYADYALWQREWLQGSGVRGQGSGVRDQRDKETRRHGDTETRSTGPQHPAPNTQHPTPSTQHPTPNTQYPTPIQAQLAYWKQQLAGAPPLLDLPTDRTRAALRTFRGATQTFALAKGLSEALREVGRREAATPFMLLLAAFTVLLHRYTAQEDIVVGTPIAGRTRVAIEGLIGFFVNTLVLRTDLAGRPSFRELLRRVREVCLGAYAHQDLPFEKLVEELQPERDLSRTPLFQVVFAMQNTSAQSLELPGLSVSPMALQSETAKFDLTLFMHDAEQGLIGTLEYDTDLFDAPTITRLAGHLQTLLEGIVATPDLRVPDLPLLTPAEQYQLIVEWNASSADYPRDVCVYQLFAEQVARIPDAVALVFQRPPTTDQRPTTTDQRPLLHPLTPSPLHPFTSQHLTYRELNQRANQLAHHLRALGVGPDVLVGICMERGLEMIVGILSILKAGGAYVPLDPTYPQERLQFMLEDTRAPVLLTQKSIYDLRFTIYDLEESASAIVNRKSKIVNLDADWPTIAAAPPSDFPCPAGPEQLAYVIYTSGSTGRPKGVMVKQRSLINLCFGLRAFFDDAAVHTTGLITSISFDISVNQIFPTLLFGRALHIIPDPVKYDSRAMVQYLDRNQVDLLDSVPSYLNAVLTEMHPERLANTLKYILVGGEKLEQRLLQKVFAQLGERVMIVNIYGLTEITDINSFSVITSHDLDRTLTIGRPLNNNQIYITDRYNNLQPVGVTGELCIAGESLSRGYLNRPELTAERFIPNPFAGVLGDGCWVTEDAAPNTQHPTPNTRFYKTGDLGRRLADGTIELFGRIDHQVKVHGFRIEVGEIEALLDRHPAVRENVVVVREDAPGDKRLVAYLVTSDKSQVTSSVDSSLVTRHSSLVTELRAFLKAKLPDYMVPMAFVVLEGLPHTPNGKIDRKALPVPDQYRTDMEGALVAPRTPTEELLAGIWADVLHVEHVGIHDSFFELGGHSLLATQIVSRVRQTFQIELSLRSLFETPTVATLAERIEMMRHSAQALRLPPIQPVARDGAPSPDSGTGQAGSGQALPLSFAQQRLWFLHQLQPDSPAYNIPVALRLVGPLDLAALEHSLNTIIARHEALRTTFALLNGRPVQRITPQLTLTLTVEDLPDAQHDEVRRRFTTESQQPFDLERGPLVRTTLLRLDAEEHLLLLTMHHIVSDGWSTGVLIQEASLLYSAAVQGRPAALPDLPIQYADFAIWQRQWLQGSGVGGQGATALLPPPAGGGTEGGRSQGSDVDASQTQNSKLKTQNSPLEAQLAYWREQLGGRLPVLDLPTDRPRPAVQTFQGAVASFSVPPALARALTALSQQEGVTLFMTLLAAFQTLLHRYSAQDDLIVGSPIAGRTQAETEGLIGFFVNTLVLRVSLAGDLCVRELLGRVREVCLGAYAHQDLPFEKLVEELRPERDLSRTPLFQVMFALQNAPAPALELAGLTLQQLQIESGTARFDLTMWLEESDHGLLGWLEYTSALFDDATIARLLRHFETILQGMVAQPDRRLSTLPLLSDAERHELLVTRNATMAAYPAGLHVPHLIAAQATRAPDAVAVVAADAQLTYHDLLARAHQLAHHLRMLGVGPDVPVALCLERTPTLLVALLGVLAAGGAYMPLDSTYPTERLALMLADAAPALLLTQRTLRAQLPPSTTPLLELDVIWQQLAQLPAHAPRLPSWDAQLAYLIYTSGSTGRPKGVQIPRQALSNLLQALVAQLELRPDDILLAVTTLAFDIAGLELFGPLTAGARVVLLNREQSADGTQLRAQLACNRATVLQATPATWRLLLAAGWDGTPELRLWCGGEVLPRELAQELVRRGAVLWNLYGPTETTIWSSAARVGELVGDVAPLGQPLTNTQLYVLDGQGQPVPDGVVGELYIGGAGLARGYLNRPDLTAERFIPNPFAGVLGDGCWVLGAESSNTRHPTPNTRLYKTGDLVRYRHDGTLEYVGRMDGQVKLRGFRIELGEIEAALGQHGAVRECVVVAREDVAGDVRLVAYVVPKIEDRRLKIEDSNLGSSERLSSIFYPLSSELRTFLQQHLPDYMVPSAFVRLEALPLTPSGKLDRRALPAPDTSRPDQDKGFVAPRTPTEEQLAGIMAEILLLERVGIYDSFFELGGHSLLATQIVSRVQAIFGVELPLRSLFETPTVAGLAEQVGAVRRDAPELSTPWRRSTSSTALPLSFAQQRMWLLDQFEPDNPAYTIPAAARLKGQLDLDAWTRSLNEIVRRHATLRTTFGVRDGRPVQVIAPALTLRVLVLELRGLAEAEQAAAVERLTAAEAQRPFNLARGPLLRVRLLRLDAEEHLLLLTMHHIISDGWSLNVFVEELAALYAAYLVGASSPLPELPIQYADYALWQREWLQGSGVGGQGATTPLPPPAGGGTEGGAETSRHGDTETWSTGPQHPTPNTHHPSPSTQHPTPNTQYPTPIQAQLAYWKQQLAGAPPLLDLPTDRTRAALRTFRGATQTFALARELSEALRGMSRREAVTPFMTLLAAFTVLLHRYTAQEDIVVGTPIAGRTRVEIEKLIGFFLNTLVLRMDLAGQPSFRELLRRVREVCLGAYAHQDLPFEQLLEELQPERDLSHTPLFQVFFNMLNFPNNRVELPGLSLEILAPPDMGAKFDLTLYVEEKDQRFEFNLVYNADLFEPDQMRELLEQLHHLLLQIAEHPEESIDHFSLIGHTAYTRLPDPTEALDSAWHGAVHTALSRQARRVPERLAVTDPHESWTYAELDARSNQLANYLIEHGIQHEEVVAIYAHRSAALVWALMGVLKAGAAFVILDPAYPAARLISYLQIAQPRAWVQIEAAGPLPDLLEEFVAAMPWRCRCALPGYAAALTRGLLTDYSVDGPGVEVGPDDLACIGFTSGSTGKPKGILGRHGPLTHFMPWQAETFGLAESDRFSMLSGIAHDPLQRDIFTPLWLGALICIPDHEDMRVPGRLATWMQQAEISIAHLTPALGQVLTETTPGMTIEIGSLRYAFIVGDVLTRHDVSRIRALAPAVTCVNFYGATETQRAVGYYIIPKDGALDHGQSQTQVRLKEILPLGRGMRDAQLLVLNAAQQLAGIGEVGEIYVRSPHLARGYLGDEALTRERFFEEGMGDGGWGMVASSPSPIPHPPSPGTRLYRTGDLGRYLPDGTVEFFGRADQQVKIRGFRVELGEIEAVLGQHPSVREVVVMAREDAPGDKRLVAYVVPKIEDRGLKIEDSGSDAPDPLSSILYPLSSELRGFLKERLPAYMIPAALVALDALPLTPNGKVDRRALPNPDSRRYDSEATYVAPQTDMERIIAAVWREVLRVEVVGIHDNFFDLGGSSIHIVQLYGKLCAVLAREVPILEMFNYPTVGSLARYISREQHVATPSQENKDRIQKQKAAMKRQRQQRSR